MADTEWLSAGFKYAQWGLLDTEGRLLGREDISDLSAGYSSNVGRLRGVRAAPFQINEPDIQQVLDRDSNFVSVIGDVKSGNSFTLEVAAQNIEFRAACDGYSGDLSNIAGGRIHYPNLMKGATRRLIWLLFTRQSLLIPEDDTEELQVNYEHLQLFRCSCIYLGSGYAFQEAGSYRYLVQCHEQPNTPDGLLLEDFYSTKIPGDLLDSDQFYTELPVSAVVTNGRNLPLQTTLTADYPPYNVGRTSAVVDGETATVSSVSGNIITLSDGFEQAKRAIAIYQTPTLD